MAVAEIHQVEKAFGPIRAARHFFDLQRGQKSGWRGHDVRGKTTLLKLLAGVEQPDFGSATIAKAIKWSYVSQVPSFVPGGTLHHQVSLVFEEVHELEAAGVERPADAMAGTAGPEYDAAIERYTRAETLL